jgi:uncharacterized protein YdhG (YjbR/CyaY superfamily)
MKTVQPKNIDEYITNFPVEIREVLEKVRYAVRIAAPDAQEAIKYGMPAFQLHGEVVYFAAFKHHVGFYPAPIAVPEFERDLSVYKVGKGSIQFPLDEQMPLNLIKKLVKFYLLGNRGKKTENKEVQV